MFDEWDEHRSGATAPSKLHLFVQWRSAEEVSMADSEGGGCPTTGDSPASSPHQQLQQQEEGGEARGPAGEEAHGGSDSGGWVGGRAGGCRVCGIIYVAPGAQTAMCLVQMHTWR
jgi:hypothetical protein